MFKYITQNIGLKPRNLLLHTVVVAKAAFWNFKDVEKFKFEPTIAVFPVSKDLQFPPRALKDSFGCTLISHNTKTI